MNRAPIALAVVLGLMAASFWAGREWRDRSADLTESRRDTSDAQAGQKAEQAARGTEQKTAAALAEIGEKHEQARAEAESVPAAVAADLRAGNVRLRSEWAGCETQRLSDASAAARERDALAESRDRLAGEIVRIGRDADDQLRAAQAVILADRQACGSAGGQGNPAGAG